MNLNGNWDINGNLRQANFLPFRDYTGYEPMNSVNKFADPERWQPGLDILRTGIYAAQQFLTPQMRLVTPFTFEDVSRFELEAHARIGAKVRPKFKNSNSRSTFRGNSFSPCEPKAGNMNFCFLVSAWKYFKKTAGKIWWLHQICEGAFVFHQWIVRRSENRFGIFWRQNQKCFRIDIFRRLAQKTESWRIFSAWLDD